jgi:hypothetical protein
VLNLHIFFQNRHEAYIKLAFTALGINVDVLNISVYSLFSHSCVKISCKIITSAIGKTSAAQTVLESLDVTKYSILTINISAQVGTNTTTAFILIWEDNNSYCMNDNLLL